MAGKYPASRLAGRLYCENECVIVVHVNIQGQILRITAPTRAARPPVSRSLRDSSETDRTSRWRPAAR